MNGQPISDDTWVRIRIEFTLPALGQVHRRLSELMEDPEPVMRQLVRVFLSGLLRLVPFQLSHLCSFRETKLGEPSRFGKKFYHRNCSETEHSQGLGLWLAHDSRWSPQRLVASDGLSRHNRTGSEA